MARGRAFVCWLDHDSKPNEIALHQGDTVWFRLKKHWWKAVFRCLKGKYVAETHGRRFCVYFCWDLKPFIEGPK